MHEGDKPKFTLFSVDVWSRPKRQLRLSCLIRLEQIQSKQINRIYFNVSVHSIALLLLQSVKNNQVLSTKTSPKSPQSNWTPCINLFFSFTYVCLTFVHVYVTFLSKQTGGWLEITSCDDESFSQVT